MKTEPVNLELLSQLREAWLQNRERIEGHIEMRRYFTKNGYRAEIFEDCQTDCCLAGWGAVLLGEKEKTTFFDAKGFANDVAPSGVIRNFLFGSGWPNNYPDCLARMDYVIKNGEAPEEWDYNWQPETEGGDND